MQDRYVAARRRLVEEIEEEVRETRRWLGKDALDARVIDALLAVPRHEFVPADLRSMAYLNRPLPIGHRQTISQPYIIAVMTDLLALPANGRVLEVVEPLGYEAKARLERLNYDNIHVRIGDGFAGWPEAAPFDAIIVTAAADEVPPPLVEQLKPGGRMIIPVQRGFGGQELVLIDKDNQGTVSHKDILPVRFVPLTGDHE
jgi:protein-L-isoaspartate(D-aspartate) O-methyltransferase